MTDEAIRELLMKLPVAGSVWRHVKSGKFVTVKGRCVIEKSLEPAVLYAESNFSWCRPASEFNDGRFELIDPGSGGDE